MADDRHYFTVEVVDTTDPAESIMHQQEADDIAEVQDIIAALDTLEMVYADTEVRVNRMTNLDAPLTDGEEQDLEDWIAGLEDGEGPHELTPDTDDDSTPDCRVCDNGNSGLPGTCAVCDGDGNFFGIEYNHAIKLIAEESGIPEARLRNFRRGYRAPSIEDWEAIHRAQKKLSQEHGR